MLKLADNPPMQHPPDLSIDRFPGRWWAARTRPRQEKALAWDVLRSEAGYFLPMYDAIRHRRGRRWKSRPVLFPGYLFLCGQDADRLAALKTQRIVQAIEVVDQRRFVAELLGVQRMLEAGLETGPATRLKAGSPCRIVGGPLAGLEGLLERRRGRSRFVLMVSILGQGVQVEVDTDLLEPL